MRPLLLILLPLGLAFGAGLARDGGGPGAGVTVVRGSAPSSVTSASGTAITGTASVLDGDTIEIRGVRIRLDGIDAPEGRQACRQGGQQVRCGQQSALHLADRIGRRPVSCEPTGIDRYGRTLAICRQDGEDLNAMMVRDGQAAAYRSFSRRYVGEEDAARRSGRGVWAGEFEMPWDWRRRN